MTVAVRPLLRGLPFPAVSLSDVDFEKIKWFHHQVTLKSWPNCQLELACRFGQTFKWHLARYRVFSFPSLIPFNFSIVFLSAFLAFLSADLLPQKMKKILNRERKVKPYKRKQDGQAI